MIAQSIARLTARLMQFALALCLLVQVALWTQLRIEGSIRLPEGVAQWVAGFIFPPELEVAIAEITLQRKGILSIRGISASVEKDFAPFVEIRELSFLPNPRGIFNSSAWLEWLRLDGLVLHGQGTKVSNPEPLLQVFVSLLEKSDSGLNHSGSFAKVGNLDLLISGGDSQSLLRYIATLEELIPSDPDDPAPLEFSLEDRVRLTQRIFQNLQARTRWLSDPFASIRLGSPNRGLNEFSLDAWIFSSAAAIEKFEAKSSAVQGKVNLHSPSEPFRIEVRGKELSLWEDLRIQDWKLQGSLSLEEILSGQIPTGDLLLSASFIHGRNFHFRAPLIRIFDLAPDSFSLRAALDWMNHPVEGRGRIWPSDERFSLNLSGTVDPERIAQEPWIPGDLPKNLIQSDESSQIHLLVETAPNWVLETVRFRVALGTSNLHGLPVSRGYAWGYLTPKVFYAEHFEIQNPEYELRGSYRHAIDHDDFRFLIEGGFLPLDINAWMSGWWERTWAEFTFFGAPPHINFDIQGNWRQRWNRDVFGAVEFSDLQYRQLKADHGRSRVRFIPNFFELSDLEIQRPEGFARGRLRWIRKPDGQGDRSFELEVESSIFPSAYGDLVGPETAALLDQFKFTTAPQVSVRGKLFLEENSPLKEMEKLSIKAVTENPFFFYGLPMDKLFLIADYSNQVVGVTDLSFGFAGGSGSGRLNHDPKKAPRPLYLSLQLENAHPAKAWRALPFVTEEQEDRFDPIDEFDDSVLNLTFAGMGNFPDLESFEGIGSVDLLSPNLANIRLFGLISRLMEALPLPFYPGSINFYRLETDFKVGDGKILSENLKLLGATTRVEARGSYSIADSNLDFMATLNPLRESRFPFVSEFSRVFQPIGRILEFRVTGSPGEPDIRFRVDPRALSGEGSTPSTVSPPGR